MTHYSNFSHARSTGFISNDHNYKLNVIQFTSFDLSIILRH